MAIDTKRSGNERLKYGICLNDECSKCKSKEVQSFPMRKELICTECGSELRECPPPKKKKISPVISAAAVVAIVVVVLIFLSLGTQGNGGGTGGGKPGIDTLTGNGGGTGGAKPGIDTLTGNGGGTGGGKPGETLVPPPPPAGDLKLSDGVYSGAVKNGYPHGQGKLTYTKTRVIHRSDMKAREAQPGNYIIGEFHNGFVVYGKLYDASGNLLSSLNFGVGNESSYESK